MTNMINKWWNRRRAKYYRGRRWHLAIEIFLATVILILAGLAIFLSSYHPVLNGIFIPSQNASSTDAKKPLSFEITAAASDDAVAKGEPLKWKLEISNTGVRKIERLDLSLDFLSAAFSSGKLSFVSERATSEEGLITVRNLAGGESIDLAVESGWVAVKADYPRSLAVKLSAQATSGQETILKEIILPEIRIESELAVSAAAYFHSPQGDQLGIGPMPPIVGVPTTYWLIIKASNEGNSLDNFVVSFHLPAGVELSTDMSLLAGKYAYNKESRRVFWQVDEVDRTGGDYVANFGLVLTPKKEQAGNYAKLAEQIRFNADDTWTGTELSGQVADIDTSLPSDRFNRGEGRIQSE